MRSLCSLLFVVACSTGSERPAPAVESGNEQPVATVPSESPVVLPTPALAIEGGWIYTSRDELGPYAADIPDTFDFETKRLLTLHAPSATPDHRTVRLVVPPRQRGEENWARVRENTIEVHPAFDPPPFAGDPPCCFGMRASIEEENRCEAARRPPGPTQVTFLVLDREPAEVVLHLPEDAPVQVVPHERDVPCRAQ